MIFLKIVLMNCFKMLLLENFLWPSKCLIMRLIFTLKGAAIRNFVANERPLFTIVPCYEPTFKANQRPMFTLYVHPNALIYSLTSGYTCVIFITLNPCR